MTERIEWQYTGVAPWQEIVDWCFDTFGFGHEWSCNWETFYFNNEQMYTLFLLRWS